MKSARGEKGRNEARAGSDGEAKARGSQWGGEGGVSPVVEGSEQGGQCGHHRLGF